MGADVVPAIYQLAQCPVGIIWNGIGQFVQHIYQYKRDRFCIIAIAFLVHWNAFSLDIGQCCVYLLNIAAFF